MEPVGLTASLFTLASATSSAIKFFHSLHNTPLELQNLHQHVRQLRSALELKLHLKSTQLNANVAVGSPPLKSETMKDLESLLSGARSCLELIETSLTMYSDRPNKFESARWVLRHRTKILRLVENMHRIEQTVTSLLLNISTYINPYDLLRLIV